MEKIPLFKIGESLRRGIETTFIFLDENLCEFEKLVKGNGIKSEFYVEKNNLSFEQRKKILFEIEKIKKTLKELKHTLKLSKTVSEIEKTIWAHCSGLWEALAETGSKHLKRYGEIPLGLPGYLDPKIAEIIEGIKRISDATGRKKC